MSDVVGQTLDDRLGMLVEGCRILEMEGHGDKTLGHVSVRDPEGRGAWIKRSGIGLGEVASPSDFVLVAFDGKILSGSGARSAEWPIHTEIYRAWPEIGAVAHTYPFHACVLGTTEAEIDAVVREGNYFRGRLPRYRVTSNLITTPALGAGLAETLGQGFAVLMRNHGVVFCGRSLPECIVIGLMLERACRAQFVASASGLDWTPARPGDQIRVLHGMVPEREAMRHWNYWRRRLVRRTRQSAAGRLGIAARHAG